MPLCCKEKERRRKTNQKRRLILEGATAEYATATLASWEGSTDAFDIDPPAGTASGDVICVMLVGSAALQSPPTGWTEGNIENDTAVNTAHYWRIADGTATDTFTHDAVAASNYGIYGVAVFENPNGGDTLAKEGGDSATGASTYCIPIVDRFQSVPNGNPTLTSTVTCRPTSSTALTFTDDTGTDPNLTVITYDYFVGSGTYFGTNDLNVVWAWASQADDSGQTRPAFPHNGYNEDPGPSFLPNYGCCGRVDVYTA